MDVHVIEATWVEHKATLRKIRGEVFIEEQNVPQELEWDEQDAVSTHFLAVNELGQYIGCARLTPQAQIGRMAVLKPHRGSGIGALLLEAAVATAQADGLSRVFLHAQSYAETFYRKGGFIPFGSPFTEAGIEHIAMEMMLPLAFDSNLEEVARSERVLNNPPPPALRTSPESQPRTLSGLASCSDAMLDLVAFARRRLLIMSPYLDHELFDRAELIERISHLARSAPRVDIQVLILSSKLIVDRGHQMLDLARRLDEKIAIRRLAERPTSDTSTFVCADLSGYWLLPNFEEYDGVCDLGNPVTTQRLIETFNIAWRRSQEDSELRLLRL